MLLNFLQMKKTLFFIILFLMYLIVGCSSSSSKKIGFTIKSNSHTNFGKPVYVLVKNINNSEFIAESYEQIEDQVFENPPNKSVLSTHVLVPDDELEIQTIMPTVGSIGFYCMYSNPGPKWKIIFSHPFKDEYEIFLGKKNVKYPADGGCCLWPF